ncbi:ABC-2 type transport system ATP-binding protein [Oscillospiraceae bacterium]|nr:ABC-2 type transport system ATP-binding protein [Oscillospiraceae bacterium]
MSEILRVDGLVKRYKELIALDNVSLKVKEGEIFGLLGPNGSGKSTTINCILSLLDFDKGKITVFGKEMTPKSYDLKKDIGVVPQEVAVYDTLTVYENIDFFCGLYIKDKAKRKQYVQEAIDFVALNDFTKFRPKKLSGGLKRRLNIACGIAHKPKLIFFDEPTVAVDPQSRNKILEGIEQLRKNGATIVYTSHYMEEVEQLCDRLSIIDKGHVIAEGTIDELKGMIKKSEIITIETAGLEDKILDKIGELPHVFNAEYKDNVLKVEAGSGKHNVIDIVNILQDNGYSMKKIFSEQPTLNDVFLELTGKELRDE